MKNDRKKFNLRGKLFFLFWAVIITFFMSLIVINSVQLHEIETAKAGIQVEIDEYKSKIAELERNRSYYDSDAYVEKVAREQLGLVKPDEILYYNDAK